MNVDMHGKRFWQYKKLDELDDQEWESLCDGCGRCCLHKLEDIDTGKLHYTRIACRLLDLDSCRCRDYHNRFDQVADCLSLRHDLHHSLNWLPASCAYRLLAEGKDLPGWHPLQSGDAGSVETAGISIRHFAVSEEDADDPFTYLIDDLQ